MLDQYTSTIHTHCPSPSLEARLNSKCGAILEIPYPSNSQSHALEFPVPISLPHTSLNHSNSFRQEYENPPTLPVKREKMLADTPQQPRKTETQMLVAHVRAFFAALRATFLAALCAIRSALFFSAAAAF